MTDPIHPASGDLEAVAVPSQVVAACKGEQEHFEAWAKSRRYEMSEHPLHYIFNDPRTDAARMGWNAALAYVREQARPAPPATAAGVGEAVAWLLEDLILPHESITRDREAARRLATYLYEGKPMYKVTPLYTTPASHDALLARVRSVLHRVAYVLPMNTGLLPEIEALLALLDPRP